MEHYGIHMAGTAMQISSSLNNRKVYPASPGCTKHSVSVGVGFSYADNNGRVGTTEEAAQHVASFLSLWFEAFPQFEGRKLHLSGESYGVRIYYTLVSR
jgi:hypothetical protein